MAVYDRDAHSCRPWYAGAVWLQSVQVLSKLEKLKEESIYGGDNDDKGGQVSATVQSCR